MSTTSILNLRSDPQIAATDRRRGHRFQPPVAELRRIPALYATEDVDLADKVVHLHFFVGGCDWYIVELDPETFRAFGWANLGQGGEWGYIDLAHLAVLQVPFTVNGAPFRQPVERDCWWTPATFAEVRRGR